MGAQNGDRGDSTATIYSHILVQIFPSALALITYIPAPNEEHHPAEKEELPI